MRFQCYSISIITLLFPAAFDVIKKTPTKASVSISFQSSTNVVLQEQTERTYTLCAHATASGQAERLVSPS